MSLDISTGLPEVEHDFKWRVSHPTKGEIWWPPKRDTTKLQVELIKKKVSVHKKREGRFWWARESTVERVWWETVAIELCKGTSPVAVLNAAQRIMNKRAEQAKTAALVGEYPPMKLEVS